MTQSDYTNILKCITFGMPAIANDLIQSLNKELTDLNTLREASAEKEANNNKIKEAIKTENKEVVKENKGE